jgi:hypothetical protein
MVAAAAPGEDAGLYAVRRRASLVDGSNPLADGMPWVTFAAIDWLEEMLRPADRVFEWGSGGSTLFFARRAGHVVSIEHDRAWSEAVEAARSPFAHVERRLVEPELAAPTDPRFASGARNWKGRDFSAYVAAIEGEADESLDLVLVDGRARPACLEAAMPKIKPGGWVVLDNANYPRYTGELARLRAGPLRFWRTRDLSGAGPYSRTPAWTTMAWRRPPEQLTLAEARATRALLADRPVTPFMPSSWLALLTGEEVFRAAGVEVAAGREAILRGESFDLTRFPGEVGCAATTRSHSMRSQAWLPLELALAGIGPGSEAEEQLVKISAAAGRWLDRHEGEIASLPAPDATVAENFVAYDVALAARFELLAELVHRLAGLASISERDYARLLRTLLRHGEMLAEDGVFSAHSNHGMLQTFAQIRGAARLAGLETASPLLSRLAATHAASGRKRLAAMIDTQFAPDGGHLEHSPSYHLALVAVLERFAADGLLAGVLAPRRLAALRAAAMPMIDCAGRIAEIGDTDRDFPLSALFREPAAPTAPATFALPQAGYWAVKGRQEGRDVYLIQTAAFHSRTHKQADAGAFLWREGARDILIDAGLYGYVGRTALDDPAFRQGFWYADPRRRYVETTRAHNAFSLNGLDQPRYRSAPYGSGLKAWTKQDGVFASETSIANLPRASHFRILAYRPGGWLLCLDAYRTALAPPVFGDQHFQFGPDWRVQSREPARTRLAHADGTALHVASVFPGAVFDDDAFGRGDPQTEDGPALWGWYAPRHMAFEPCAGLRLRSEGDHVVMASLMGFDEASGVEGDFNVTRRRLRIRWTAKGMRRQLTIDRAPAGLPDARLRLAYAEQPARKESESS